MDTGALIQTANLHNMTFAKHVMAHSNKKYHSIERAKFYQVSQSRLKLISDRKGNAPKKWRVLNRILN